MEFLYEQSASHRKKNAELIDKKLEPLLDDIIQTALVITSVSYEWDHTWRSVLFVGLPCFWENHFPDSQPQCFTHVKYHKGLQTESKQQPSPDTLPLLLPQAE